MAVAMGLDGRALDEDALKVERKRLCGPGRQMDDGSGAMLIGVWAFMPKKRYENWSFKMK